MVRFVPVYQSPLVRIAHWHCDGHSRAPGEPDVSREPTFAFVTRGLFRRHSRRVEVLAGPGAVLFFQGQSEYRTSHPCDGGDGGIGVRVYPEGLEEILDRAGLRKLGPEAMALCRWLVPLRTVLRLKQLGEAVDDGASPLPDVDETALLLIGDATSRLALPANGSARRPVTRRAHRRAVERVMELVQTRLHERLRLEEIAREASYSPYHLCRVFRDATGMSIHRYVNRQRLLAAVEHVRSERNLTELALQLGFASHSHFSMAFRKEFGVPPAHARCR